MAPRPDSSSQGRHSERRSPRSASATALDRHPAFNIGPMSDLSFDLVASSLRADATDTRSLVEALAAKLERALPTETHVERKATKLLSRERRVTRIEMRLGDLSYTLRMDGDRTQTQRSRTSRGIVIKSEELSLDAWLDALADALRAEAQRSESTRLALERLLG